MSPQSQNYIIYNLHVINGQSVHDCNATASLNNPTSIFQSALAIHYPLP